MQEQETKEKFYPDGTLRFRQWLQDGKLHRPDGPAEEVFRPDGTLQYRHWFQDGKRHRSDGPAVEKFYPDGSVERVGYWLSGIELPEAEYHRRALLAASRQDNAETDAGLGGAKPDGASACAGFSDESIADGKLAVVDRALQPARNGVSL